MLRLARNGALDLRSADGASLLRLRRLFVKDLGGEDQLSIQQLTLVDQIAVKMLVLEKMAHFALARGVLTPDGRPIGALGHNFLAWSNSLRLDLQTLGLERRLKRVTDLHTLLAEAPGMAPDSLPAAAPDG